MSYAEIFHAVARIEKQNAAIIDLLSNVLHTRMIKSSASSRAGANSVLPAAPTPTPAAPATVSNPVLEPVMPRSTSISSTASTPIPTSDPVPVIPTPKTAFTAVVSTPVVSTPVVSTPVVSTPVVSTPVAPRPASVYSSAKTPVIPAVQQVITPKVTVTPKVEPLWDEEDEAVNPQ